MELKKFLIVAMVMGSFAGCSSGEKDADKIGDAQFCIDKLDGATSTTADIDECLAKIEGITSAGAEGIRCAAGFIRERFTIQRFSEATSMLNSGTSGTNMQNMLGLMSFTSTGAVATDLANASSTFDSCLASGGKGSVMLSSFSYITLGLMNFYVSETACTDGPVTDGATGLLWYDLGDCLTQPAAIAASVELGDITTVNTNAITAQSGIGSVLVSMYRVSCSGTGANRDLCNNLKTAIDAAGGIENTREIAIQFIVNSIL